MLLGDQMACWLPRPIWPGWGVSTLFIDQVADAGVRTLPNAHHALGFNKIVVKGPCAALPVEVIVDQYERFRSEMGYETTQTGRSGWYLGIVSSNQPRWNSTSYPLPSNSPRAYDSSALQLSW